MTMTSGRMFRFGVSGRVTLGLIILVLLTVAATGFAIYGTDRFRKGFDRIMLGNVGQLTTIARVIQRSETIAAVAPRIATARDRFDLREKAQIAVDLGVLLDRDLDALQRMEDPIEGLDVFQRHRTAVEENLATLTRTVEARVRINAALEQVGSDAAAVSPRIDDLYRRAATWTAADGSMGATPDMMAAIRALDLARGLIVSTVNEKSVARVKAAESRVANLLEAAEREISAQDYSWLKVLAVVVHRDLGTLTGEDGVFDRRREELRLEASIRGALSNHDVLASRYVASASSLFADMEERITNERDVLAEFVRQGSSVLIGLAVLASLAGALIFFYVRYGVLNRLVALQQAMLRRTRGEKAPIPRKGDDEINDMADGISYFVTEISRREAQFKGFAESSSDYFWETDTDFRFTYFSDRFSEMTSVPAEEIIGLKIEETPNLEVDPDD